MWLKRKATSLDQWPSKDSTAAIVNEWGCTCVWGERVRDPPPPRWQWSLLPSSFRPSDRPPLSMGREVSYHSWVHTFSGSLPLTLTHFCSCSPVSLSQFLSLPPLSYALHLSLSCPQSLSWLCSVSPFLFYFPFLSAWLGHFTICDSILAFYSFSFLLLAWHNGRVWGSTDIGFSGPMLILLVVNEADSW